jgi:PAS domain S-box-containing protein
VPAEQRLSALLAVSAALASSKTGAEARERIVTALAEGLGWPLGAFWGPDEDGARLVCLATWSAAPAERASAAYETETRDTTFTATEGLPGRVWASGQPLWTRDVREETAWVRTALARQIGLATVLLVPVRGARRVRGVIELAALDVRETDQTLFGAVQGVGEQLGQFLDREEAEEQRRVSEARSQAILASALDAVVAIDHKGRITEFNPASERIFGFRRDEVLGQSMGDVLVPPHLRDAHRNGLQRYLDTEEPHVLGQRLELPARHADGSLIPCELYIVRIPQEGPPAFTAFLRDITERKEQEEALRSSEARTRALVDRMLEGLIVTDPDGVIQDLNPAGQRIFGYAREEIVGQSVRTLMPPEHAATPDALSRAYESSVGRVTEWPARRKSGEIFPMELQLWEFDTAEGRLLAGYVRDLSERHEIDRLKKEFVGTVSHELRTPLTSLRGSLGLLTSGVVGSLPPDTLKMVEIAERNTVRLIDLINGILDLERLGTGAVQLILAPTPLAEAIEKAHEAVAALAREAEVTIDRPRTDHVVNADEQRLVQVLVNLLGNAIKFSSAGSGVELEVDVTDGRARVRVLDRGRGVPGEMQQAIFEPFRQVEGTDARREGGSGLGLAISRAIVEQHGGRIGVEPREGGGSVFWFTLPLPSAAAGTESAPPEA